MKKIKKKLFNHHSNKPATCNDLVSIETTSDDVINPNFVEPEHSAPSPISTGDHHAPPPGVVLRQGVVLRHKDRHSGDSGISGSLLSGLHKKLSTSVSNLTEDVPRRRPPRPSSTYDVTKHDDNHQSLGNRLLNMVMHPSNGNHGNGGGQGRVKTTSYNDMDPNSQIADMFLEHVRFNYKILIRKIV